MLAVKKKRKDLSARNIVLGALPLVSAEYAVPHFDHGRPGNSANQRHPNPGHSGLAMDVSGSIAPVSICLKTGKLVVIETGILIAAFLPTGSGKRLAQNFGFIALIGKRIGKKASPGFGAGKAV